MRVIKKKRKYKCYPFLRSLARIVSGHVIKKTKKNEKVGSQKVWHHSEPCHPNPLQSSECRR